MRLLALPASEPRSLPGLFCHALAAPAPLCWSGRVVGVAGVLAQPVEFTLGPLGATAELVTGLLEDPRAT